MEESPRATVALVEAFLMDRTQPRATVGRPAERRVTPSEFKFSEGSGAGTGTSGVSEIRTVVLKGDPDRAGLYTIMLQVPAHTRIASHDHHDDRVATVRPWFSRLRRSLRSRPAEGAAAWELLCRAREPRAPRRDS
jgi:hypothetical protein